MRLENIIIILVEPESPGNIGSVARAMKTTGLKNLRLVNPCLLESAEMRMMAHRSRELVDDARHYSSLQEALKDMTISIGTTMRKRSIPFPKYTPEEIASKIKFFADDTNVALVFGREKNGLYNDELNICQLHSTIPILTQNPALNLAQAVMIYSYVLSRSLNKQETKPTYEPASSQAIEAVYTHLEEALNATKFKPRDNMKTFISRFRRLLGRTVPEFRDIQMLHKIIQILAREKE